MVTGDCCTRTAAPPRGAPSRCQPHHTAPCVLAKKKVNASLETEVDYWLKTIAQWFYEKYWGILFCKALDKMKIDHWLGYILYWWRVHARGSSLIPCLRSSAMPQLSGDNSTVRGTLNKTSPAAMSAVASMPYCAHTRSRSTVTCNQCAKQTVKFTVINSCRKWYYYKAKYSHKAGFDGRNLNTTVMMSKH